MSEQIGESEASRRLEELKPAFEIGHSYARVERSTIMPDDKRETNAEHVLSLAMIGIAYATKYHPELDPYKLAFYFLFHDIDEFLYGDQSSLGISHEGYKAKVTQEAEGRQEIHMRLEHFPEFLALLDTIDDLTIPENAFGKAADKLSPGYTHEANGGKALREQYAIHDYEGILDGTGVVDEKMYEYAAHFVDVIAMRRAMHKRVAQKAFGEHVWDDSLQ